MTKKPPQSPAKPARPRRSASRRSGARRSGRLGFKTILALMLLATEAVLAALLLVGLVVFYKFSKHLPNVSVLVNDVRPPNATTIWSSDGVLLGRLNAQNRIPVTLADIDLDMQNATIAIEDHRFYHHFGVDPKGILRAALADFTGGRISARQGASTLTQQLVRNVGVFGISRQKKYSRKVREALIAMRIEQFYSKHEILSLYLNNVYYGAGAYGVEAAAETYYGIHAAQLDLAQAALLAGLPQRPSSYSPFVHMRYAIERQGQVLDAMLKYGYINQQQHDSAEAETLHFIKPKTQQYNFRAPYFVWYVLDDLYHRYGSDFVNSGLKIVTTLNWKMQHAAEQSLKNGLANVAYTGANQACLISLDNSNGYIRAMVGGRSFRTSQFNISVEGLRQPGSTFKLFDYATAFDLGAASVDSRFRDVPVVYPNSHGKTVHDFEGYSYRNMTCRDAIAQSINTIAVQVAALVGIHRVIAYAHHLGIRTPIAPYLPSAIGASALRPIDLCVAYSCVAANGVKHRPVALISVTDSQGNVIEQDLPHATPGVLKQSTIDQLNDAFSAVVHYGTGVAARGTGSDILHNVHGKTGTTSDFRDAWFAGYTPELTTVVWGGDVHHGRYLPMRNGQGAVVCAPIWHDYMMQAVPEEQRILAAKSAASSPPSQPQPDSQNINPTTAAASKPAGGNTPNSAAQANSASPAAQTGSQTPPALQQPPVITPPSALNSAPPLNGSTAQGSPNAGTTDQGSTAAKPPALPHPSMANLHTAPPVPRKKPDKMVTVTICAESHLKATIWCPVTIQVKMPESEAKRLKKCNIHHPPPGAG